MQPLPQSQNLHWPDYDGALFDLDGVITDTADVHAACWKRMFDAYLQDRSQRTGEPFVSFSVESDYLKYVDGRPRLDGVRTFLESRGIELPEGSPDDPAEMETVHGLGTRKNELVLAAIEAGEARVYQSSVEYVKALLEAGKLIGIVTSSANCDAVLRSVGLLDMFPVRVDGRTIIDRRLRGKPAPDAFIAGAEALDSPPIRLVVFEDAISGVQAGRNGGFGCVVGVARHVDPEELRVHGADLVVRDLAELKTPVAGGRPA